MKTETHLCEHCARSAGVDLPGVPLASPSSVPPEIAGDASDFTKIPAIPATVGQFIVSARGVPRTAPRVCGGCGLAFADFRQTGILGCPDCYEAFADQLEGLIARSHAGATCHTGRRPGRSQDVAERKERVRRLLRELNEAIATEQFERAARIRDDLRTLNVDPAVRKSAP